MRTARVLVVDDDPAVREQLRLLAEDQGYQAFEAGDGAEGLEAIRRVTPDVVLTDARMPVLDGTGMIVQARKEGYGGVFLVMTAFATIEASVEAMRAGADNFLVKPLTAEVVIIALEKATQRRRLQQEAETLRERIAEKHRFHEIVGESSGLRAVLDVVQRVAPTRANVLLLGESGTGKDLLAQALHEASERRARPFIKVHCAALSENLLESELFGHERGSFTGATHRKEGRFELADGGTLFLDEIGEIPPATQVKLLRVLQNREFERVGGTQTLQVDVRVVAATNRELREEVRAGRFREDLFYRLNVVSVTVPPLRRRGGDIARLADHFLRKYATAYGKQVRSFGAGVMKALRAHDWPGNVRELENAIECAVALSAATELRLEDLPPSLRGDGALQPHVPGATLREIERAAILKTLETVGGSTSKAARILGVSTRRIQYRLKELAEERAAQASEEEGAEPPPRSH